MKMFFQIVFWIGIGSMSIGFLSFSIIQIRKYHQKSYLQSLATAFSPSEKKFAKFGVIFLVAGIALLAVAFIYHILYGLN
jgi:hypothetical protein